jgi:hypothetical protein
VPETRIEPDPATAELLAVSVNTVSLDVGFGLNDAVTPLGSPDAIRVTFPVGPPKSPIVTGVDSDPPSLRIIELYIISIEIVGTIKTILVDAVTVPHVPVTVTV